MQDDPRWVRVLGLTVALPTLLASALVLAVALLVGGNELLPQADAPPGSPDNARRAAEAACDRPGGLRTFGSRVVQLDRVDLGIEFQCTFALFQWPHYGGLIWCEEGEWLGPDSSGSGSPVDVPCGVETWPPTPPVPPPVAIDCTNLPPPCGMPPPPFPL